MQGSGMYDPLYPESFHRPSALTNKQALLGCKCAYSIDLSHQSPVQGHTHLLQRALEGKSIQVVKTEAPSRSSGQPIFHSFSSALRYP